MSIIVWDNWQGDVASVQPGYLVWDNWRGNAIVVQDETPRALGEGVLRGLVDPEAPLAWADAALVGLDTQTGPAPGGRVQRVRLASRVRWRTP